MSGYAVVRRVDRAAGRVDVMIYPASCGRCEEDGGHCTRKHRVMPARLPEDIPVAPGDHVVLKSDPAAAARAFLRGIVLPILAGVAGLFLGGARFSAIAPLLAAQLRGDGGATIDLPVASVVFAIAGVLAAVLWAIRRGARPSDWPRIAERSSASEGYRTGTAEHLTLRPVSIETTGADLPRN